MNTRISNEMMYGFVSNIIGNALMFLTTMYLTQTYSTEIYGEFRLLSTFIAFFVLIVMLGRDNYIIYESQLGGNRDNKVRDQFYHALIFFILVTLILCIFSKFIIDYVFQSKVSSESYYLSVAMLPLWGVFNLTLAIHKISGSINFMFLLTNLIQRVSRFFAFLTISLLYISNTSLYIAMIISQVAILTFSLSQCKVSLKIGGYRILGFFHGLKYSFQLGLNAIILIFLSKLDVMMIGRFLDNSKVAIYDTSALLAFVILIPFTTLVKISEVEFNLDKIDWKKYKSRLQLAITLSFGIFLLFSISGYNILFFFGQEYVGGYSSLMILSIGYIVQCYLGNPVEIMNMNGHARISTCVLLLSLLVNFILNSMLIPIYGLNGAALSTVFSIFIYKVVALFFLRRKLRIKNFYTPSLSEILIIISFLVLLFFDFDFDFDFDLSNVFKVSYGAFVMITFYFVSYLNMRRH
ncbi:polysaccharide biosynthesis C-terminal domain-containing protein [Vibrio sp. OPT10]|uniref:polysaccharide biosynthesis C-terminal domain-containing protein n=1 Tax=Vibrio sp. OPT10 TaxID=2778640 RepID=UPI0018828905|nr:polysaccharide biosynthesis C-terminal domain-containing protein [Vibrio sp. OPT10]MBE8607850.1 polysaccharide biosynthesis C-terminal domain-containing protein [Vibrio sp. OPT10]